MRKIMNWVLAAILICGASVITSCSANDTNDNPSQEQAKENRKEFVAHTRATLKDLAENLNFSTLQVANTFNQSFNERILNNPDFEKTISTAFFNKALATIKPLRGRNPTNLTFKVP